jgi:hypothetical protein
VRPARRCLELDPQARFRTLNELGIALNKPLRPVGLPVSVKRLPEHGLLWTMALVPAADLALGLGHAVCAPETTR